ncbi:MAG TPA: hypothetical protein VKQ32_24500 [Polyangia bacterium]|nr:hypothetical protein [Polyangia bacterium]
MRPCALLLALVCLGAACSTTTTVGSFSDGSAQRWLAEKSSSDMTVETNDSASSLDDVRIEAISPTDVRFRARSGAVVPIERVRRVTVTNHSLGAMEGLAKGAAAGVAFGLVFGLLATTRSSSATADCDVCLSPAETGVFAGVLFGVPMMVLGLIQGAINGHQDVLELK